MSGISKDTINAVIPPAILLQLSHPAMRPISPYSASKAVVNKGTADEGILE